MKEYKKLDWSSVVAVCRKHHLYDNGTTEQYRQLADFVNSITKSSIEIHDMEIIALNILEHSTQGIEDIKKTYGYNTDEEVLILLVNELNYSTRIWIE